MGSKKELIQTARLIVKESEEVVKMARKVAEACTDKRMKRVSEKCLRRKSWFIWSCVVTRVFTK